MDKTLSLCAGWKILSTDYQGEYFSVPFGSDAFWKAAKPIAVPCAIQAALFGKHCMYRGKNCLKTGWVLDKQWWYRNQFGLRDASPHATLQFEGFHYEAHVWLNGTLLGYRQGMYGTEFDVSGLLRKGTNDLVMAIDPAPRVTEKDRASGAHLYHYPSAGPRHVLESLVPAGQYERFWANHIPLGILRPACLHVHGAVTVNNLFIRTLEITKTAARMRLSADLNHRGFEQVQGELSWICKSAGRQQKFNSGMLRLNPGHNTFTADFVIRSPQLWQPWEFGERAMYELAASFAGSSGETASAATSFGIRTLEWTRNDRSEPWQDNETLCVNGRKLYLFGTNIQQLGDSLGYESKDLWRDRELVRLAKLQGVNCLRIHEIAPASLDFFRLCDEAGIFVLQDCLLNRRHLFADKTQRHLNADHLRDQAGGLVRSLRNHPSLMAWAGGNELYSCQLPTCEDPLSSRNISTVQENIVRQTDPSRRYFKTCPERGKGETHMYQFEDYLGYYRDDSLSWFPDSVKFKAEWKKLGVNYRQFMERSQKDDLLITEFVGAPDMPDPESLKRFMDPADFAAWKKDPAGMVRILQQSTPGRVSRDALLKNPLFYVGEWWSIAPEAFALGVPETLEDLTAYTQLARSLGGMFAMGVYRSRMFHNSGNFYWAFNDPNPACNFGVLDYYLRPKRTYYDFQQAFRRTAAFALYKKKFVEAGETFSASLHAVNATEEPVRCKVTAQIWDSALNLRNHVSRDLKIPAQSSVRSGAISHKIVDGNELFFVRVLLQPEQAMGSELVYWLNAKGTFRRSRLPATTISARCHGKELVIVNSGTVPAFRVEITALQDAPCPVPEASGFWLEPGQSRSLGLVFPEGRSRKFRLKVCAWNSSPIIADSYS